MGRCGINAPAAGRQRRRSLQPISGNTTVHALAPLCKGRLGAALANVTPLHRRSLGARVTATVMTFSAYKALYLYRHLFSSIRYKNFNLFYAYGIDFNMEITVSLDGALTKTLYWASLHTAVQLPAFENI